MINGIKTGKYFRIGEGNARKSILMAEDIFRLLPKLIEKEEFLIYVIIIILHFLN